MALDPTAGTTFLDITEYCVYKSKSQVPRFLVTRILTIYISKDENFLRSCITGLSWVYNFVYHLIDSYHRFDTFYIDLIDIRKNRRGFVLNVDIPKVVLRAKGPFLVVNWEMREFSHFKIHGEIKKSLFL